MSYINAAFDTIFREAFYGIKPGESGTWFVEKHEGFFDAVDNLSAAEASKSPGPGISSIAAHTDHARYYIEISNAFARSEEPVLDWDGSWKNQVVDELEWNAIRADLRVQVDELLEQIAMKSDFDEEYVTGMFAGVAHAGFHLGAMRQLIKLV